MKEGWQIAMYILIVNFPESLNKENILAVSHSKEKNNLSSFFSWPEHYNSVREENTDYS